MKRKHLYHATYRANLKSIKKLGLIPNFTDNWEGLSSEQEGIYFNSDPECSISFCEAAPGVSDDVNDSGIVLICVPIESLDKNYLKIDGNDGESFIYIKKIPFEKLYIVDI